MIQIKEMIELALKEDIGTGDITSNLIIKENTFIKAEIIAKEDFLLAGIPFVKEVFFLINKNIKIETFFNDGDWIKRGSVIAKISGNARDILLGERVSLNILQHISGIATMTKNFIDKIKGLPVQIVDTRKTLPNLRLFEKYGVAVGGGKNHRFGLYDGVLIKDNHIKIAGGIKQAVSMAKSAPHLLKIEVEVKNLDELKEAIEAGADVIMLDNMSIEDIKEAVKITRQQNSRILLEASGNVNLENVRDIAETGVDLISVGAITHSARAVDISMKVI
jgi:nicotinate-nucleotide pyrophosphorylase (carboxylating)